MKLRIYMSPKCPHGTNTLVHVRICFTCQLNWNALVLASLTSSVFRNSEASHQNWTELGCSFFTTNGNRFAPVVRKIQRHFKREAGAQRLHMFLWHSRSCAWLPQRQLLQCCQPRMMSPSKQELWQRVSQVSTFFFFNALFTKIYWLSKICPTTSS